MLIGWHCEYVTAHMRSNARIELFGLDVSPRVHQDDTN
jgi:hypothetical protein